MLFVVRVAQDEDSSSTPAAANDKMILFLMQSNLLCAVVARDGIYTKNVGNFATSLVEGPEKTLRCRWGNSNPRI